MQTMRREISPRATASRRSISSRDDAPDESQPRDSQCTLPGSSVPASSPVAPRNPARASLTEAMSARSSSGTEGSDIPFDLDIGAYIWPSPAAVQERLGGSFGDRRHLVMAPH